MIGRRISIGLAVLAASSVACLAQTPVLSNLEAPYAAMQGSVQIGGHVYGAGAVAYGPAGTPLVLTGSDLGTTGTVTFIAYKNGVVDTNVQPVAATHTMWTSNMIFAPVPSGAYSGMVQVTVEGKQSNLLPFMVTPGSYAGTCPAGPSTTQLQIITASLHDGAVNQSYSATLNATGGTQTYTWSVASGTLPAGLSLNPSTGTISGMPTTAVSPASVTFGVTDSGTPHQNNQALLDLTIEPQTLTSPSGGVYNYTASYDGNGNVTQYTDTVMGSWNFSYDALNRLQSGTAVSGGSGSQDFVGQNLCWAYDSYGNRTAQSTQTAACPSPSQESTLQPTASYNTSNRITWVQNTAPAGFSYDAAGNATYDGMNYYAYDGEGRVCAVQNYPASGGVAAYGYIYDAEGIRVAKGSITPSPNLLTQPLSCDPTANGFQLTENYVVGPGGEELSMLDGSNNWQRTNVYAAGKLIGTYDAIGLHFHLEDPLGTRRMQLSGNPNSVGQPETDIQSLPYGDALYSFADQYAGPTADDATPLHFTGKERDAESGNDYFGARYYASSMGRFMSPDWSAKAEPVPYAKLADPQSLNLYVYVLNNPMTGIDKDGHCASGSWWCDAWHGATQVVSYAASTLYGKAQVGVGLGGEVKLGPAKVKVEAKDVTETRTAKDDSSRKEVTEVKASVKVGPVEVGLGITGEKPLQDANGNAPADAKTEWTPLLGFDYKSLSTDSHGWDVGVGAGGCVVLCLGAEGGVNAGKVVSDATTLLKQSVDAMQTLTGPTY